MCDGNIVYQGEASKSAKYFDGIGIHCPRFANPADFFIKSLTISYPKGKIDEQRIFYLTSHFDKLQKN